MIKRCRKPNRAYFVKYDWGTVTGQLTIVCAKNRNDAIKKVKKTEIPKGTGQNFHVTLW